MQNTEQVNSENNSLSHPTLSNTELFKDSYIYFLEFSVQIIAHCVTLFWAFFFFLLIRYLRKSSMSIY